MPSIARTSDTLLDASTIRGALICWYRIKQAGLSWEFGEHLKAVQYRNRDAKLLNTGSDLMAALECADEVAAMLRCDREQCEQIARDELLGGHQAMVLSELRSFYRARVVECARPSMRRRSA